VEINVLLFTSFRPVQIIPIIALIIWQRFYYVDPKIKYFVIGLSILVIVTCAASLIYVWGFRYPGDYCINPITKNPLSVYLYQNPNNQCFQDIPCIGQRNRCAIWDKDGLYLKCGFFNGSSDICR